MIRRFLDVPSGNPALDTWRWRAIGRAEGEGTYRAMAGSPQGVRPAAARRSRRALAPSGQDAGREGCSANP
jgi:hypothetical protein